MIAAPTSMESFHCTFTASSEHVQAMGRQEQGTGRVAIATNEEGHTGSRTLATGASLATPSISLDREETASIFSSKKRLARFFFGLVVVVTCIVVGVVSLVAPEIFSKNHHVQNDGTSSSSILEMEERFTVFRTLLYQYSPPWVFMLPSTPQTKALEWLIFDDTTLATNPVDEGRLVQRYALMTLFYACGGPTWKGVFAMAQPWDALVNINECEFAGVQCNEQGAVTHFVASNSRMVGKLPDEVGLLGRSLTHFVVDNNELQGSLDTILHALTNLEFLDLEENRFVSTIPPEIGRLTNLETLRLRNNHLTGIVPPNVTSLTNLHRLRLTDNAISGQILEYVHAWPHLVFFDVEDTLVTGSIPESITARTQLEILRLNDGFNGTIPERLADLTNLRNLVLQGPGLVGTFAMERLSNLESLVMHDMEFRGSLPSMIGSLTALRALSLTRMFITGTIPTQIGLLTNLRMFSLFGSSGLRGSLPTEIGALSSLKILSLSGTGLSGTITPDFCGASTTIEYPCTMTCSCCPDPCDEENKFVGGGENGY